MADSGDEIQQEFEELEQAESSMDSGLESAPRSGGMPSWIKWMVIADLLVIAAVLAIVFLA